MAAQSFDYRTALVVVDVQNDFADPGGSLYVAEGDDIVPRVNELIAAAGAAGALIVYTQAWHTPETPPFAPPGGTRPVHFLRHTSGASPHPAPAGAGPAVRKLGRASCRGSGVQYVWFTGVPA